METVSGRQFWPASPVPGDIDIEDAAHSLSHQPRFGGHTFKFYSVLQHQIYVAANLDRFKREGLCHDNPEYIVLDMPSPIKHGIDLGEYPDVEREIAACFAMRYDLIWPTPRAVKDMDNIICLTERRDLMPKTGRPWSIPAEPLTRIKTGVEVWGNWWEKLFYPRVVTRIRPWSSTVAKRRYLRYFHALSEHANISA